MNTNNGWLAIASAPKTGRTLLLGYWNSHGKWRTVRGQWVSADHIAESFEDPDDIEAGWFETAVEADDMPNCWPVSPSHWQPMPAAPDAPAETPAYTVTVDPDPRGVSVGVYLGSSCVYHGAHEVPAGAVADEGAVKRLRDAIEGECGGNWISEKQAAAVLAHLGHAAPAAGDALDAARYRWICDKFGVTKLPCAIERIIEGKYVADGKESIDAAIDAAIAASQQGGE